MVSTKIENYEVVNILPTSSNRTWYKVRNVMSSKMYAWKAVTLHHHTKEEKDFLLKTIEEIKVSNCPSFVKLRSYILHEQSSVLYLITNYFKNGNLRSALQKCIDNKKYFTENYIWYVLYRLAHIIKTNQSAQLTLNLDEIFLDDCNEISIFYVPVVKVTELSEKEKLFNLGRIIYQLCTLSFDEKDDIDYSKFPEFYSDQLYDVVTCILQKNPCIHSTIDTVLQHPTLLMHLEQLNKNEIVIPSLSKDVTDNVINNKIEKSSEFESITKREMLLRLREQKIQEKEYELEKREKRVCLTERLAREKLRQAELYLKRSRHIRPNCNKRSSNYDNLDTSFSADCGESTILPTGKQSDLRDSPKPAAFSRTMSERHVRFRGHSPLKDIRNKINFSKAYDFHPVLISTKLSKPLVDKTLDGGLDKQENARLPKKDKSKRRSLFSLFPSKTKEVQKSFLQPCNAKEVDSGTKDIRPISWTHENKKQAFELLRIMNNHEQKENCVPLKHTCL